MGLINSISGFFSGTFLAPQFFWFLGLIPIVILLYLLKLRRTEAIISSTLLWTKSLQDLTANAPFQRLRKNLLLLLQIIVLLLIIAALARPFIRSVGRGGTNYGVIIDHSASMQTIEGETTRLTLAKEEALRLVSSMQRGDKMMVMSFAESAAVLCELTDDSFRLRHAIESIEPTDTRTKISDAMMVVRSMSPSDPDRPEIVRNLKLILLSDGGLTDLDLDMKLVLLTEDTERDFSEEFGARGVNMTYVKVGQTNENAGIVGFSMREPREGKGDYQTLALLHNEGDALIETTATLSFGGEVLKVEEVTLEPHAQSELIFTHPELGEGVLHVTLDVEDALAVDNEAWLALQPSAKVKVLLVSEADSVGGYYLKRALGLEPRVELSTVDPSGFAPTDAYDLTVFDGFTPPSAEGEAPMDALPSGMLVFFNALPPLPGLLAEGTIENPPVLATETDHPAMRFLNPSNIAIQEALRITLPEGARTLVSTIGGPLVADVSRGGQQIAIVAFDIGESNWPLQLSFPLFVQNLVSWSPRAAGAGTASVPTGKPLVLLPNPDDFSAESAAVRLVGPDDAEGTVELDPLRPVFHGATEHAGIYRVFRPSGTEVFAVNLLDRKESSITPVETINFGGGRLEAAQGGIKQTRELWRWFVLGAICFLSIEWLIYSRRAWV